MKLFVLWLIIIFLIENMTQTKVTNNAETIVLTFEIENIA